MMIMLWREINDLQKGVRNKAALQIALSSHYNGSVWNGSIAMSKSIGEIYEQMEWEYVYDINDM